MAPLETYCKEILHSGCALVAELHSWEECPAQDIYKRIATKHQTKLKSLGFAIGTWIDEKKYKLIER